MLIIQTVNQKSEQGHSEPFLCTAANGEEYFVKGKLSGRTSQINEWLCACMAEAIGLPIAPFTLLEICEDLYDELPKHLIEIGKGICFGSLAQKNYALLEAGDVHKVPIDLQRKIAAPPQRGAAVLADGLTAYKIRTGFREGGISHAQPHTAAPAAAGPLGRFSGSRRPVSGAVCAGPQRRSDLGGGGGGTLPGGADGFVVGAAEPAKRDIRPGAGARRRRAGPARFLGGAGSRAGADRRHRGLSGGPAAGGRPPGGCGSGHRKAVPAGQRRKVHSLRGGQHQEQHPADGGGPCRRDRKPAALCH